MFLMNAPPVAALQSTWEAFGPPGSCRLPGCFSESQEGVVRAAVSARVQRLIGALRRHQATRGMSDERGVQGSPRAGRGCEARLASSPAGPAGPTAHREPPTLAACALAADFNPAREKGATGFSPLVLDSDSDDSVDRDIEEAIQEYLKAKSSTARPTSGAQLGGAGVRDTGRTAEPPCSSPPAGLGPPRLAAGTGSVLGSHTRAEAQGAASPVSVSSDDSFEQSIRAEIEQFLSEKRQHGAQRCAGAGEQEPDPRENSTRDAPGSCWEPPGKAEPRQALTAACREFVFRKPPRLARGNVGSWKPATPCRSPETAQNKGPARRSAGAGRRGRRAQSAAPAREPSESSSDDGIEEAIQLYQLEKTRKGAGRDAPGAPLGEDGGPSPPTDSTSSSMKSASPETHRKTPSKKQQVALKAAEPTLAAPTPEHPARPLKDTRAAPPADAAARAGAGDWGCRADTPAELMCAEAILDISKTILPAPTAAGDGPLPASPLLRAPSVPSRSDGDSSSVDSDDSIEQEIRTFLALKAQSGSVLARAEGRPQPSLGLPLSPDPSSQTEGIRAPRSKTPDLSPRFRRKRKSSSSAVKPPMSKKTREGVKESSQDPDHSWAELPGQGKATEAPGKEGEARGQPLPSRTAVLGSPHGPQGHSQADEARRADGKGSSEDKSSSLDSDEDLDTAIKDLLRSKRKLKRKCKGARPTCKRKCPHQLGGRRARTDGRPHVLKSCLSRAKGEGRERPERRPAHRLGSETEGSEHVALALHSQRKVAEAALFSDDMGVRGCQHPAPSPSSPSDDSSSVDSDDSIELEIRKFLAEKAKESVSSSEAPGGNPATLGPGGPARPETLCRREPAPAPQPGVCTRSQRARGAPQPAEGLRGTESSGAPAITGLFVHGRKGAPHTECTTGLPTSLASCEPAPQGTSGRACTKGSPANRRNAYVHKAQSPRGLEPAATSASGQSPCGSKADSQAGSAGGTFRTSDGSRSLLAPGPGAERDRGSQASLALPWSDFAHQSRLLSPWALSLEGRDSVWKGGLGGERERGSAAQARCPPTLGPDPRKSLPFPGFSPLLSTQLFHFGKSVSWGCKQAGLFSSHLGLPLQGPSFSGFREAQAVHSPVFGGPHLLGKKEGGHWPQKRTQAGLGLHDRRDSGSEDNVLDLRYRQRVSERGDPDQEALGSDASDFSDTSVEDSGGSSVVKGTVLQL
ncbi:hypothetical protein TREES_T100011161 [Tupaia chinensis]|uniref:Protein phosphatase 1 regulatory subunit 26 N-terminal domain-containing protein n=1 Tax=Tupaia chinensis TaxID=246437 RepID=L8YFG9_TUPCH|nr:hypothetical protein TREES_T100011161 [Tupaia chinensis]